MRLRHNNEEAAATPHQYDSETVRRVLARAAELDQTEEPLSAAQVEQSGMELGISPASVRQALGEVIVPATAASPVHTLSSPVLSALTPAEVRGALIPGLIYALLQALFFFCAAPAVLHGSLPVIAGFILPIYVAFIGGLRQSKRRLGALCGAFTVAVCLLTLLAAMTLREGYDPAVFSQAVLIGVFLQFGLGAMMGGVGAMAGQRWRQYRSVPQR